MAEEWCRACGGEIQRNDRCIECGLLGEQGRDAYYGRMPQTNKEKQEAFRARQAMLGHTEVRGIYAPPALHAAIKEAAKKLLLDQECEKHLPGFKWDKPEEKK
jgi:hypothetical protein